MPTAVSSKHTKNNPTDEDRTKKEKHRSSSSKRRRRDRDSSSSPSPSPHKGKISRRGTRRRRRSSSHGHDRKRRKDSKKSNKKKIRKSRSRRDSSSSSSRSCSTCSSPGDSLSARSRSPSPVRSKAKSRVRGRSSGRDRARRSRYRSPSPSSCSGCSSHSSRSASRSPHREDSLQRKGRSRRLRSKLSDGDREKIPARSSDYMHSQSNDEVGYNAGRRREKKWQPENAADVEKDDVNYQGEDDSRKKGQVVLSKANGGLEDPPQGKFELTKDLPARKNNTVLDVNSLPVGNLVEGCIDPLGRESGLSEDRSARKNIGVVSNTDSLGTEDLEMILRKKALENFKKFWGGLSDGKNEHVSSESSKDAGRGSTKGSFKSLECKPASSIDNHRHKQGGGHRIKVAAKSVSNPLASGSDDNVTLKLVGDNKSSCSINNQNNQIQVNNVHESSKKISSEQPSMPEDIQGKKVIAEPKSGNVHGREATTVDRSASGTSLLSTETGTGKSNEPTMEAMGGSQFEQKTFSRMHDGEVVQVSYKLYIPKKRPSFTQRQPHQ